MKHPEITGVNGDTAATLQDLGFEQTKWTTPKRRNKGAGLACSGTAGAGVAGAGADAREVGEGSASAGKKAEGRKEAHISHCRAWTACRDHPQTLQVQFRQK